MKTSLIIPTYNEEKSIKRLIESILNQSVLPDEVIIVDSLSKDKTVEIVKSFKSKKIEIISKKTNISEARNLAIKNAKNEYILATDAGGYLDKDWVKNMKKGFEKGADYVMGNFRTIKSTRIIRNLIGLVSLQTEKQMEREKYFASSRSVGFKKKVWETVRGYPENLYTGEDTLFNLKVKKAHFKPYFAKDAIVYWEPRNGLKKFIKQFYLYGKGDGESKNIFEMKERLAVFFTYFFGHILLIMGLLFYLPLFLGGILLYLPINFFDTLRYLKRLKRIQERFIYLAPLIFIVYLKRTSYTLGVLTGLF